MLVVMLQFYSCGWRVARRWTLIIAVRKCLRLFQARIWGKPPFLCFNRICTASEFLSAPSRFEYFEPKHTANSTTASLTITNLLVFSSAQLTENTTNVVVVGRRCGRIAAFRDSGISSSGRLSSFQLPDRLQCSVFAQTSPSSSS